MNRYKYETGRRWEWWNRPLTGRARLVAILGSAAWNRREYAKFRDNGYWRREALGDLRDVRSFNAAPSVLP